MRPLLSYFTTMYSKSYDVVLVLKRNVSIYCMDVSFFLNMCMYFVASHMNKFDRDASFISFFQMYSFVVVVSYLFCGLYFLSYINMKTNTQLIIDSQNFLIISHSFAQTAGKVCNKQRSSNL